MDAGIAPLGESHGIRVVSRRPLTPRLLELRVTSSALVRPAGLRVLLPSGYSGEPLRRYPVLFLLHGGQGGFRDWTESGDVERLTADEDLIVMMPSGGQGGWYADWRGAPLMRRRVQPRWTTFHLDELVPWTDATFRTLGDGRHRAIAGVSMGGFGALSYTARRPDLFAAAASYSGAVHIGLPLVRGLVTVSPLIDRGYPGAIFGLPPFDRRWLQSHNPWHLAEGLRGKHVVLTTGNGRRGPLEGVETGRRRSLQEHQVHAMNVALHRRLTALHIVHEFHDRGDGRHLWAYWSEDLRRSLPGLLASISPDALGPVADAEADR